MNIGTAMVGTMVLAMAAGAVFLIFDLARALRRRARGATCIRLKSHRRWWKRQGLPDPSKEALRLYSESSYR